VATGCSEKKQADRLIHEAMAVAGDEAIGHLVRELKSHGFYEKTLIAIASDNGGLLPYEQGNQPLRGGKNTLFEGGVRIRAAIGGGYLPLRLRGRVWNGFSHMVDWYPTLSALAGVADPTSDPRQESYPTSDLTERSAYPVIDGISMLNAWNKLARTESSNASGEYLLRDGDDTRVMWQNAKVYTYVTRTQALKVYAEPVRPCPYDPGARAVRGYNGCPWADPAVCPTESYPCSLESCSMDAPCVFDLLMDPSEQVLKSISIDAPHHPKNLKRPREREYYSEEEQKNCNELFMFSCLEYNAAKLKNPIPEHDNAADFCVEGDHCVESYWGNDVVIDKRQVAYSLFGEDFGGVGLLTWSKGYPLPDDSRLTPIGSICQQWCDLHPKSWRDKCSFQGCSGCAGCKTLVGIKLEGTASRAFVVAVVLCSILVSGLVLGLGYCCCQQCFHGQQTKLAAAEPDTEPEFVAACASPQSIELQQVDSLSPIDPDGPSLSL